MSDAWCTTDSGWTLSGLGHIFIISWSGSIAREVMADETRPCVGSITLLMRFKSFFAAASLVLNDIGYYVCAEKMENDTKTDFRDIFLIVIL